MYIILKGDKVEIFVLVVLGLVQGICEFLPISSSGHLVLLSSLFGVEDSLFVSIVLHVATLLAVIIVFWKDIVFLLKHPLSKESMNLALATIPTCIIVLILMPLVKESFGGGALAVCFFFSALLLFITQKLSKSSGQFTKKNAIIMGIAQGIAVFPGISRSGTTICAGLLSGAERKESAKFSFLMSIPIILLSLVMEIYEISVGGVSVSVNTVGVLLGAIVAFTIGILSIKLMLRLTEKANFKWFIIYLIIIGILTIFI